MRVAELSLESGDELDVRGVSVVEPMSAAFRVDLGARSRDDALDFTRIVGKRAQFRLRDDRGARAWTGVCAEIAQTGVEPRGLSTYRVRVVPRLWLLTQRRGHRLFQHLPVPEVVAKILAEWRISPAIELTRPYPRLPTLTQYGESDYDFVRRLLAEAGISFFFRDTPGEETHLVITDAPGAHGPEVPAVPFPAGVSHLRVSQRVVPARVTFTDHDFRRPRHALTATHAQEHGSPLLEAHHYVPGHSLAEASSAALEPVADGQGIYRYKDERAAERARQEAEANDVAQTQIGFATARLDLAPGTVFSIAGHPHPEVAAGERLLVTHAFVEGDVGAAGFHAGGRAVRADRPYRPAVDPRRGGGRAAPDPFEPLRYLGKPSIRGVESAIVTGPPGEAIHTDEHGRVALRFPWDREGAASGARSPWARVSQAWAGAGQGMVTVPRVGDEVLASYEDGDPDRPVVVGRLFNGAAPVPYALPEHKTRTTLRTAASDGGNEITFDDASGAELLYMQAERDLHKLVGRDELEHTHGVRHIHAEGDLAISTGGTLTIVGKDIVVKGGPNVLLNHGETPPPAKKPARLLARKSKGDGGTTAKPKPKPAHKPPPPHHGKGWYEISERGREEMKALERVAAAYASGRTPEGWCLKKVEDYLQEVTYGKIGHGNIPRFEYAHDFADYLNKDRLYEKLGLQRLPIYNPYDAPEGSIIVVRAGTPGTANPVAGDIVVKGPGDHFYNDGEMGYEGPGNFPKGNDHVLGIYAPK